MRKLVTAIILSLVLCASVTGIIIVSAQNAGERTAQWSIDSNAEFKPIDVGVNATAAVNTSVDDAGDISLGIRSYGNDGEFISSLVRGTFQQMYDIADFDLSLDCTGMKAGTQWEFILSGKDYQNSFPYMADASDRVFAAVKIVKLSEGGKEYAVIVSNGDNKNIAFEEMKPASMWDGLLQGLHFGAPAALDEYPAVEDDVLDFNIKWKETAVTFTVEGNAFDVPIASFTDKGSADQSVNFTNVSFTVAAVINENSNEDVGSVIIKTMSDVKYKDFTANAESYKAAFTDLSVAANYETARNIVLNFMDKVSYMCKLRAGLAEEAEKFNAFMDPTAPFAKPEWDTQNVYGYSKSTSNGYYINFPSGDASRLNYTDQMDASDWSFKLDLSLIANETMLGFVITTEKGQHFGSRHGMHFQTQKISDTSVMVVIGKNDNHVNRYEGFDSGVLEQHGPFTGIIVKNLSGGVLPVSVKKNNDNYDFKLNGTTYAIPVSEVESETGLEANKIKQNYLTFVSYGSGLQRFAMNDFTDANSAAYEHQLQLVEAALSEYEGALKELQDNFDTLTDDEIVTAIDALNADKAIIDGQIAALKAEHQIAFTERFNAANEKLDALIEAAGEALQIALVRKQLTAAEEAANAIGDNPSLAALENAEAKLDAVTKDYIVKGSDEDVRYTAVQSKIKAGYLAYIEGRVREYVQAVDSISSVTDQYNVFVKYQEFSQTLLGKIDEADRIAVQADIDAATETYRARKQAELWEVKTIGGEEGYQLFDTPFSTAYASGVANAATMYSKKMYNAFNFGITFSVDSLPQTQGFLAFALLEKKENFDTGETMKNNMGLILLLKFEDNKMVVEAHFITSDSENFYSNASYLTITLPASRTVKFQTVTVGEETRILINGSDLTGQFKYPYAFFADAFGTGAEEAGNAGGAFVHFYGDSNRNQNDPYYISITELNGGVMTENPEINAAIQEINAYESAVAAIVNTNGLNAAKALQDSVNAKIASVQDASVKEVLLKRLRTATDLMEKKAESLSEINDMFVSKFIAGCTALTDLSGVDEVNSLTALYAQIDGEKLSETDKASVAEAYATLQTAVVRLTDEVKASIKAYKDAATATMTSLNAIRAAEKLQNYINLDLVPAGVDLTALRADIASANAAIAAAYTNYVKNLVSAYGEKLEGIETMSDVTAAKRAKGLITDDLLLKLSTEDRAAVEAQIQYNDLLLASAEENVLNGGTEEVTAPKNAIPGWAIAVAGVGAAVVLGGGTILAFLLLKKKQNNNR